MRTEQSGAQQQSVVAIASLIVRCCSRDPIQQLEANFLSKIEPSRAQSVPPRCRDIAPSSPKDCCNPLTTKKM